LPLHLFGAYDRYETLDSFSPFEEGQFSLRFPLQCCFIRNSAHYQHARTLRSEESPAVSSAAKACSRRVFACMRRRWRRRRAQGQISNQQPTHGPAVRLMCSAETSSQPHLFHHAAYFAACFVVADRPYSIHQSVRPGSVEYGRVSRRQVLLLALQRMAYSCDASCSSFLLCSCLMVSMSAKLGLWT
jgi:hypothetical protein